MANLSSSRPPDLETEIHAWTLDGPAQLGALRRSLLDLITAEPGAAGQGLDEVVEKMLIVATELATNALRHGLPPTVVRLCRSGSDYVIDVVDHDPASVPVIPPVQPPSPGGLGLHLARTLALDVGWYATAASKHVWARFPG